eukprot:scaffold16564_cov136-Isochrysis_galbana.AAC.3
MGAGGQHIGCGRTGRRCAPHGPSHPQRAPALARATEKAPRTPTIRTTDAKTRAMGGLPLRWMGAGPRVRRRKV